MAYPPMYSLNRLLERVPIKTEYEEDSTFREMEDRQTDKAFHIHRSRPLSAKIIDKRAALVNRPRGPRPTSGKKQSPLKRPETYLNSRIRPQGVGLEKERLYDENISLKMQINAYKAELTNAKTKIKQLEKESKRQNEEIEEISMYDKTPAHKYIRLTNALRKNIKDLKTESKLKDEEINRLRKNIKTTKLAELDVEVQGYKDECLRLKSYIEEVVKKKGLESPPVGKDRELSVLRKEKNDLIGIINTLQEENRKIKEKSDSKQKTILKDTSKNMKNEIQKLKNQAEVSLKESHEKEQVFKQEILKLRKIEEDLRKKLDLEQVAVSELTGKVREYEKSLKKFEVFKSKESEAEKKGKNVGEEREKKKEVVPAITYSQVSHIFKHIYLSMQLHRLNMDRLPDVLLSKLKHPDASLGFEEVKKMLPNPPFAFTLKEDLKSFYQFLVQPEDAEYLEPSQIPLLKSKPLLVIEKIRKNLPSWKVFDNQEESEFDTELASLIISKIQDLSKNCLKYDKDQSGIIEMKEFKIALKDSKLIAHPRLFEYMVLLFYSHEYEIDKVPYKNFLKAYGEFEKDSYDEEKLNMIKTCLSQIAQKMTQLKLTVKEVFQTDSSLIYPEYFLAGLDKIGLKDFTEDVISLVLEQLQFEEENEPCIHVEELEKLMESLGVSQGAKRSAKSFSSKESDKSGNLKKVSRGDTENFEFSEDSPGRYGISEISPFGSMSNVDYPGKSSPTINDLSKIDLQQIKSEKSESENGESMQKIDLSPDSIKKKQNVSAKKKKKISESESSEAGEGKTLEYSQTVVPEKSDPSKSKLDDLDISKSRMEEKEICEEYSSFEEYNSSDEEKSFRAGYLERNQEVVKGEQRFEGSPIDSYSSYEEFKQSKKPVFNLKVESGEQEKGFNFNFKKGSEEKVFFGHGNKGNATFGDFKDAEKESVGKSSNDVGDTFGAIDDKMLEEKAGKERARSRDSKSEKSSSDFKEKTELASKVSESLNEKTGFEFKEKSENETISDKKEAEDRSISSEQEESSGSNYNEEIYEGKLEENYKTAEIQKDQDVGSDGEKESFRLNSKIESKSSISQDSRIEDQGKDLVSENETRKEPLSQVPDKQLTADFQEKHDFESFPDQEKEGNFIENEGYLFNNFPLMNKEDLEKNNSNSDLKSQGTVEQKSEDKQLSQLDRSSDRSCDEKLNKNNDLKISKEPEELNAPGEVFRQENNSEKIRENFSDYQVDFSGNNLGENNEGLSEKHEDSIEKYSSEEVKENLGSQVHSRVSSSFQGEFSEKQLEEKGISGQMIEDKKNSTESFFVGKEDFKENLEDCDGENSAKGNREKIKEEKSFEEKSSDGSREIGRSEGEELEKGQDLEIEQSGFKEIEQSELKEIEPSELKEIEPSGFKEIEPSELEEIEPRELEDIEQSELKETERNELKEIEHKEFEEIERNELIEIKQNEFKDIEKSELIEIAQRNEVIEIEQRNELIEAQKIELIGIEQRNELIEIEQRNELIEIEKNEFKEIEKNEFEEVDQNELIEIEKNEFTEIEQNESRENIEKNTNSPLDKLKSDLNNEETEKINEVKLNVESEKNDLGSEDYEIKQDEKHNLDSEVYEIKNDSHKLDSENDEINKSYSENTEIKDNEKHSLESEVTKIQELKDIIENKPASLHNEYVYIKNEELEKSNELEPIQNKSNSSLSQNSEPKHEKNLKNEEFLYKEGDKTHSPQSELNKIEIEKAEKTQTIDVNKIPPGPHEENNSIEHKSSEKDSSSEKSSKNNKFLTEGIIKEPFEDPATSFLKNRLEEEKAINEPHLNNKNFSDIPSLSEDQDSRLDFRAEEGKTENYLHPDPLHNTSSPNSLSSYPISKPISSLQSADLNSLEHPIFSNPLSKKNSENVPAQDFPLPETVQEKLAENDSSEFESSEEDIEVYSSDEIESESF